MDVNGEHTRHRKPTLVMCMPYLKQSKPEADGRMGLAKTGRRKKMITIKAIKTERGRLFLKPAAQHGEQACTV